MKTSLNLLEKTISPLPQEFSLLSGAHEALDAAPLVREFLVKSGATFQILPAVTNDFLFHFLVTAGKFWLRDNRKNLEPAVR